MQLIVDSIIEFMTYLASLGNFLMMPLVFTVLCLILGMNVLDAVRNSVKIGIGFIGFTLVNDLVVRTIGPAVASMAELRGVTLNTVDFGWAAVSTIAYATELGALMIIFALIFNIVLVLLKVTKTLDVDLWNYWQFALTGSFVMLVADSFWLGLIAALLQMLITLWIADASAEMIQKYINLPNISIAHAFASIIWLMAYPIAKFWELIGWKSRKWDSSKKDVGSAFQKFVDPVIIGLIIGLAIGTLGYAGAGLGFREAFKKILGVGMVSASMIILNPKAVSVLLDGINPISEQARKVLLSKLAKDGRTLYIGVDSAVMIQDEITLIVSSLLIPISILIAAILPGNTLIPFAGLTGLIYLICTIAPLVKGDLLKLLATSIIILAAMIGLGSNWAPEVTRLVSENGLALPAETAQVSFMANPLTWVMVVVARFINNVRFLLS